MKKKVIVIIVIILIISSIIVIGIMKGINEKKEEKSKEESNFYQEDEEVKDTNAEINKLLKKSDISNYLPKDILEIKLTNYNTEDKKTDIYTDKESILEFVEILCGTYWEESNEKSEYCFIRIEIIGEDFTTKLDLAGLNFDRNGEVKLTKGDLEIDFEISNIVYFDLYGFKKPKYYLHKSNLEIPDKEKCYKAKDKALKGLKEDEIKKMQKTIYNCQSMMEIVLGENVHRLKEKTSYYWRQQIYDEVFTVPVVGTRVYDGSGLIGILQETREIIKIIKDKETKNDLEQFCNLLQEGLDERDIGKCFEAHEILHDYSIWVINYPVENLIAEPYDWSAFKTYFGKASIIK